VFDNLFYYCYTFQYIEHQPSEAVRFIRTHGTMLPDYAKSKEMQNVSSIKAIVAMARVTDTAPPPSDMTSAVACFGSQSFTQSEHVALQAEARRIFGSYSPSGGYNQTDAGKLCFKEIHR
jgi:hypothetical protein